MAGIVMRARLDGAKVADARLTGFALANTPVLCKGAMAKVTGTNLTAESIPAIAAAIEGDLDPSPDMHGTAAMKKRWARVLLERALRQIAGITDRAAA